ncbi:helix-turn-helix transcriptional regulator [Actinokineospora auranticolor]|uniref:Helix-turn-helix protein n=1 Tax=Actinokineospora auranticolor TaxID=155976 RepID=A0A2S6GE32_9PSEU|nr:helix-turn-helix transcriptional regulator [Actinokineospora auranticolor]PPK63492.1 helix-turn-helix protein [Actinokineospora auranticolor]
MSHLDDPGLEDLPREGVGVEVAKRRKALNWTQRKLAEEAVVSLSLVKKVEIGQAPPSPAFIAAVSRALGTGAAELMSLPRRPEGRTGYHSHSGIGPLRRELAGYKQDAGDVSQLDALPILAARVSHVSNLRHATTFDQLGSQLPGLLYALRLKWQRSEGAELERTFGLLAEAYYAASQYAYKLGYVDLSSLAVDRYEWAAAQSGDQLAVLVGDYQRAGELIATADWDAALTLLETSRGNIEGQLGGADPAILAVWGNLHLKSGLAAARAGNQVLADEHLTEARETAQRIGADRDDYRLCFGPTNVGIWSVGLAVELCNGAEAVRRSVNFRIPDGTPRERAGHYYIDLARGFLYNGDRKKSLAALDRARKISPEQTRHHPMVHETVRTLLGQQVRSVDTVAGFAAWAGVRH